MNKTRKKIVLAFPPFASPTAPPLGVCALKGHIERTLPDWSAKVLDLNLVGYETVFDFLTRGQGLDPKRFPEGKLAEIALFHARDVFRGRSEVEFYRRPDLYAIYADVLTRLTEQESISTADLESLFRSDAALPNVLQDHAARILAESPDAVGISVCYNQQFWLGVCLAKAVRAKSRAPIVFGGTFFLGDTERFLREFHTVADFVVCGEGETALAGLLSNLSDPKNVSGVAWFVEGRVHQNPPQLPENLDDLGHPDFSDLDLRAYYSPDPVLPVLTSRGCYWRRCTFCNHYRSAGLTYRTHSPSQVIARLKAHADAGIHNFAFIDEMISPAHFARLARAILDAGLDINYYALAKPVKQFDRDLLAEIARSGCRYLLWGIESGSQRVVELMDKGIRLAEVSDVLRDAQACGIRNHVYVIVGFPTETLGELQQTVDFLDQHKDVISMVHRGTFALEADTRIFDEPAKFSILRTWKQSDGIVPRPFGYECSQGLSREQAGKAFEHLLPFFRAFNPFAPNLGNYRDHALLVYAKLGAALPMSSRRFPPKPILC